MKKILLLAVISLFVFNACNESEAPSTECIFENPLTDLPWIDDKITELLASSHPVSMYQCTYNAGDIGFWVDEGDIACLYNCQGETLCIMDESTGETCSEYNISNKIQIWNNGEFYSLIGDWRYFDLIGIEVIVTFSEDTIYHTYPAYGNSIYESATYKFIAEDSIQIDRLDDYKPPILRQTNNKVIFYNNDSVLIERYFLTDLGTFPPHYDDIELVRIK